MIRLISTLLLLVAVVAGVGYFRGWFQFSSDRSNGDPTYSVTVDKDKIKEDEARAKKKLQDMEHKGQEKVAPATQP